MPLDNPIIEARPAREVPSSGSWSISRQVLLVSEEGVQLVGGGFDPAAVIRAQREPPAVDQTGFLIDGKRLA